MTAGADISCEVVSDIRLLEEEWTGMDSAASALLKSGVGKPMDYSFYQTYVWNAFVDSYYRAKGALWHRLKRVEYVTVRRGGEIQIILPLLVTLFPARKVEFVSWKTSGINNASSLLNLSAGGAEDECFRRLADFFMSRYGDMKLKLNDMPVDAPFVKALASVPGMSLKERDSFHIPLGNFEGFDEYYASLSKKLRHNIQTRSNHFTHGDLSWTLRVFDRNNPPSTDYWLGIWRVFYLRKLQWNGKSAGLFRRLACDWEARKEAGSGMKTASFGRLDESRLFVFEINGEPAAFAFLYKYGDYIVVPKLAIDFRFRTHAPGILMLREIMRWCFVNGVRDFDLCRGDEPYKQQMGAECAPICVLRYRKK